MLKRHTVNIIMLLKLRFWQLLGPEDMLNSVVWSTNFWVRNWRRLRSTAAFLLESTAAWSLLFRPSYPKSNLKWSPKLDFSYAAQCLKHFTYHDVTDRSLSKFAKSFHFYKLNFHLLIDILQQLQLKYGSE